MSGLPPIFRSVMQCLGIFNELMDYSHRHFISLGMNDHHHYNSMMYMILMPAGSDLRI